MAILGKATLAAALGSAALAMAPTGASAAIVCSGDVCWHTQEAYEYPPDSKVIVHEDSWKWGPSERFSYREHEGRGYWHGDKWTTW